jgi:opacity protein-like surface antigen
MVRIVACLALAAVSASSYAQMSSDRAGRWEFGVNLLNTSSESFEGPESTSLDISSDLGIGLSAAYNFTNRLAVQFDLDYLSPKYEADLLIEDTNEIETIRARMDVTNLHVKGTFHFREGPLTPYIQAGMGWTAVDSNVADGPPTTGCWWDWWWGGYVCRDFWSTYRDTRSSYTAAFGVRWDYSRDMTFKAEYGILETQGSGFSEDVSIDTFRIAVTWGL